MESSLIPRVHAMLLDCGGQVGVAVSWNGRRRAWRFRNWFRIHLTDEDFRAGRKRRWRWPVSLWARD